MLLYQLIDQAATRDNIIQKVRAVREEAREFDHVIIHIGGRAKMVVDKQHPEKKVSTFIPYHNGEGEVEMLFGEDFIRELMPFQSTVILFLDFCHGAEFLQPLTEANQSQNIETITNNIFALSGTSPGQNAFDDEDGGYFSVALQRCYNTREADLEGNAMVYLDEVLQFTTSYIQDKSSNRQQPLGVVPATLTNIPLVQFGDTFALPKKELALGGHIEEDQVIKSIVQSFADDWLKQILIEKG